VDTRVLEEHTFSIFRALALTQPYDTEQNHRIITSVLGKLCSACSRKGGTTSLRHRYIDDSLENTELVIVTVSEDNSLSESGLTESRKFNH
jgi:hypothetical protein